METICITYRINLGKRGLETFDFELDGETFDLIPVEAKDPPKWAKLEYSQCSHCPLKPEEHPFCPLALQLHGIVARFHNTRSIDEVEMEVITPDRRVIQTTAIQRAIASMLDLVFPVCGCPKTAFMKPLARFHLPLASEEETVFRVTGMYLLAQYFLSVSKRGGGIEFGGLTRIYEDIHTLNVAVARRLQSATTSDSSKNAITLLDMYSTLVPMLLEDELAEMRCFFKAYLPEDEVEVVSSNYLEKAKAFSLDFELVPIHGEKPKDGDDRPEWLKQVIAAKAAGNEMNNNDAYIPQVKPSPVSELKESVADQILKKSGLTLELAPITEAQPPAATSPAAAGEKPKGVKASFRLPDD